MGQWGHGAGGIFRQWYPLQRMVGDRLPWGGAGQGGGRVIGCCADEMRCDGGWTFTFHNATDQSWVPRGTIGNAMHHRSSISPYIVHGSRHT